MPGRKETTTRTPLVLLASLAFAPIAGAQDSDYRREFSLVFARPAESLRLEFARDWYRLAARGREWVYCVTRWRVASTQDGDSVFLAEDARLIDRAKTEAHGIGDVRALGCVGPDGPLPIAHAHPSGDCSPSRTDARMAAVRRAPFELVICGPGATASYSAALYQQAARAAYLTP